VRSPTYLLVLFGNFLSEKPLIYPVHIIQLRDLTVVNHKIMLVSDIEMVWLLLVLLAVASAIQETGGLTMMNLVWLFVLVVVVPAVSLQSILTFVRRSVLLQYGGLAAGVSNKSWLKE